MAELTPDALRRYLLWLEANSVAEGMGVLNHYDWECSDEVYELLTPQQMQELDRLLWKVSEYIHRRIEVHPLNGRN